MTSPPDLTALYDRAVALLADRRLAAARAQAERLLRHLGPFAAAETEDVARVLALLGSIARQSGDLPEAERRFRAAITRLRRAERSPEVTALLVEAHEGLGQTRISQGRYEAAEASLLRALKCSRSDAEVRQATEGSVLNGLGMVCKYTAQFTRGMRFYRRALALTAEQLGDDHPSLASFYHNLGGLEHARGRYAKGEPYARRSVELRERALGPEHPDVAEDLAALAALVEGRGRLDEAEGLYRRALAILRRAYGASSYDVAVGYHNLGGLAWKRGDLAGAKKLMLRSLAIKERRLGARHVEVAYTLNNLGVVCASAGEIAEARRCYRRALAICERTLARNHPQARTCRENLRDLTRA
jgi:tetratricopeptide (TPR) repeat protein